MQKSGFLFISTALAVSPIGVAAQDSFDLGTLVLGERVDRPIEDVGSSVAVLTEDDLQLQGPSTPVGLTDAIPNTGFLGDGRDIVLRGVSKSGLAQNRDVLSQSQSDVITTYLDGAPISTWAGPSSLWDIEQVEVFRGVQTNTFGRGALAGPVVLKSKDPVFEPEYRLRGNLADPYAYGASVVLNTPVSDTVALRFSADFQEDDGHVFNVTGGVDEDPDRSTVVRAKARVDLDQTDLVFSLTYSDRDRGSGFLSLANFPAARVAFGDTVGRVRSETLTGSLTIDHAFASGWSLNAVTAFTNEDVSRALDGDNSPLTVIAANVSEDLLVVSQDFVLRSPDNAGPFSGFVGLSFRHFERDGDSVITGFASNTSDRVEAFNAAIFGELRYALPNGLTLFAGGRYDYEDSDFLFTNNVTAVSTLASDTASSFSPKLGAQWDVTDNTSLIVTVQRGFRASGAGATLLTGTVFTSDEEETWNYEIALRGRWLDDRLAFNANVFFVDWNDQQVEVGPAFDSSIANAGESSQYGLEIETRYDVTVQWQARAALGLLQTNFDNFISGGVVLSGNDFPLAPESSVTLGVSYAPSSGVMSGWVFDGTVIWQDAYFSDAENTAADRISDRTLVNLSATMERDWGRAQVYVNNVFDEDYLTLSTTAIGTGSAGEPRTVGALVELVF